MGKVYRVFGETGVEEGIWKVQIGRGVRSYLGDRKGRRHLLETEGEGLKFYLGRPVRLKAFAWYREGEGFPGYLGRHEWKKAFGMYTGGEEGTG